MVNILLEGYEINSDYLYDDLKKYILTDYSVAVIAFSFRDSEVKNSTEWNLLYSKEKGIYYRGKSAALLPTEYRKIILHL